MISPTRQIRFDRGDTGLEFPQHSAVRLLVMLTQCMRPRQGHDLLQITRQMGWKSMQAFSRTRSEKPIRVKTSRT